MSGSGERRQGRGAVLAAGRGGQGRPRRGDRAHRRPRPRRSRAVRRAMPPTVAKPVLTLIQKRTRTAKRALAARGMVEAVTWSFIGKPEAELFGGGAPELALANPIAAELSDMRPSLLPGLLKAAQRNADRGYARRGAVRGRAGASRATSRRTSGIAAAGDAPGLAQAGGRRPALVAHGANRSTCSTQRATPWRCWRRSACRRADCRSSGRPRLVSSRPLRHAAIRAEGRDRLVRRAASASSRSARREGPGGRIRDDARRAAAAQGEAHRIKPKLVLSDFSQFRATSPSSWTARSTPAADILKAAQAAERAARSRTSDVFDLYEGAGVPDGQEVGRRRSDAAAAPKRR